MHPDIEKILLTEEEISSRVVQLGQKIYEDYKNLVDENNPLVCVGILRGAMIFFGDLVRKIDLPMEFDFMSLSSYGNSATSTGKIDIRRDLDLTIENRHVLIIEDIVDTGFSMYTLKKNLMTRNPASFKICALMDKPARRKAEINVDYFGFESPDEFLVGYGLDYAQRYRNLPYVGILKREIYS